MIASKLMTVVIVVSSLAFAYLEMTGKTHVVHDIRCTRSGCGPI
jgi:hypothetical protein